ncbi:MAG: Uma2 family endonuclease [Blastocatellia bacterium]|nr:Uma2 family endonuclease [Blastocatellia bacterium]
MSVISEVILDPEKEYEIVNGLPEEKEMGGARHSGVGVRLIARLSSFVEDNRLGGVYGPDATFQVGPDERIPDVSFVSAARIPPDGEPESKWPFAPDLAVETLAPNDLYEKVYGKILEYFAAEVRQVWLISPEHKPITIYRSPTDTVILLEGDEIAGDDLLPGFRRDRLVVPSGNRNRRRGAQ